MIHLIAIDPGKTTGWSVFMDKSLQGAGSCKKAQFNLEGCDPSILRSRRQHTLGILIEQPRWYPEKRDIDVNDLLDLAVFVGELKQQASDYLKQISLIRASGFDGSVLLVTPVEWKGSVRKDIHNQRVLDELTEGERKLLSRRPRAKDYDHNMLDAVGLGLWGVGRL